VVIGYAVADPADAGTRHRVALNIFAVAFACSSALGALLPKRVNAQIVARALSGPPERQA
jgi:hypothetical protein